MESFYTKYDANPKHFQGLWPQVMASHGLRPPSTAGIIDIFFKLDTRDSTVPV